MKTSDHSNAKPGRRRFLQIAGTGSLAFASSRCVASTSAAHEGNTPLAQEYTVAVKAPGSNHNEGYIYFNGFARLPNGDFIVFGIIDQPASATDAGIKGHQGKVIISRSSDGGKTWKVLDAGINFGARTIGGAFFVHEDALYMFASPLGDDAVINVSRSEDNGETWSNWVEVIRIPKEAKSPTEKEERSTTYDDANWTGGEKWIAYLQTAMLVKDGRLYLSVSERAQDMAIVTCHLAGGLLHKTSWKISKTTPVSIPKELNPGYFPGPSMSTLEGNIIEINGKIRLLARQVIDRYGTSNIAAVFDVEDNKGTAEPTFVQFFPLPGGHGLFNILYDETSRLYWMASNLESNSQKWVTTSSGSHRGRDRRFLMLWYSLDALNWFPAGCIAKAQKMQQTFNYPSMLIDGDDLAIVSRTTVDPVNYSSHDADHVTFHRVRNFRSLAMNIFPDI